MSFLKFGFHLGPGGNANGHGEFLHALDDAGIPYFCKAADAMPYEAQEIARNSPVPHTVIYRRSLSFEDDIPPSGDPDVPNYNKEPEAAAAEHWTWHKNHLPPELDPQIVWVEIINEPRREVEWADWLGMFAYYTGQMALADGYKFSAFGYSAGTPDYGSWETDGMLKYLELCQQHPDRLSVSLHEYSLEVNDIWFKRGDHIGRFQELLAACDRHNLRRPMIFITEWGWTYDDVPSVNRAMQDYLAVGELYARYPEIAGAATWYLGPGYGEIADEAQKFISPLKELTLNTIFDDNPPPPPPPDGCPGYPREQYARTYWCLPHETELNTFLDICRQAYTLRRTVGFSYDDAGVGALDEKTVVLYGITPEKHGEFIDWYQQHYPGTVIEFRELPAATQISLQYRPCDTMVITQRFGATPQNYPGLPGHEGIDYAVSAGRKFYAAAPGIVVHASDRKWSNNTQSAYGWHVVLDHGGFCTVYAHAQQNLPVTVGQQIQAGDIVGYSGNTGNSTGYHLHFSVLDKTGTVDPNNGYPTWIYGRPVDPWPFLDGLDAPPEIPPPPVGEARIGLHASADPGDLSSGPGGTAEFVEFKTLIPGVIKVLSSHSADSIGRLADDQHSISNSPHWIIRAFLDFGGRTVTPSQFMSWTIDDVARTVSVLRGRNVPQENVWVELHNEPNLAQEGWSTSWLDGHGFATWGLEVLSLYKQQLPSAKYIYPGLSPGNDISGVRYDSARFLSESTSFIQACDALGIHAYWSQSYPMSQALVHVDTHIQYNKSIWVTEASRNDRPQSVPDSQYADDYYNFWWQLRARPLVKGVAYFVASASNGIFQPECWIVNGSSRGIAATIRS